VKQEEVMSKIDTSLASVLQPNAGLILPEENLANAEINSGNERR
jgi:hypothetical protein